MRSILFAAAMTVGCLLTSTDAIGQNACLPPGPDAQTSIPRPDRALLTPPAKFDCAFKTSGPDGVGGQPQSAPTPAEPGADGALRAKLDYEVQCHRHAVMILHNSLQQLQASMSETISAVDRRAQPAVMCGAATAGAIKPQSGTLIPLPDRALLTPPPAFNCEFKPTAGLSADAALQMKLDYELQCHRHAEMIARDKLRRLQASVGETIKAVDRNDQRVVKQQPQPPQPQQARPVQQAHRLSGRELARALQSGGFVIVHRYTETTPGTWPPPAAGTIDTTQRISPQGRTDAQALGEVYRRLRIPVAQVLSSESFVVYQTATAAFGDGVKLHRDLTGLRAFDDPVELERSVLGFRSRVATRPPAGTNVVLWTHEGKFMKAFGPILAAGDTVVFGPAGGGGAPREVARLSLRQFLGLAD